MLGAVILGRDPCRSTGLQPLLLMNSYGCPCATLHGAVASVNHAAGWTSPASSPRILSSHSTSGLVNTRQIVKCTSTLTAAAAGTSSPQSPKQLQLGRSSVAARPCPARILLFIVCCCLQCKLCKLLGLTSLSAAGTRTFGLFRCTHGDSQNLLLEWAFRFPALCSSALIIRFPEN